MEAEISEIMERMRLNRPHLTSAEDRKLALAKNVQLFDKFAEEDRKQADWEKEIELKAEALANNGSEKARLERAILFLQSRGQKFAVDFGVDNAIEFAYDYWFKNNENNT